MLKVQNLPGAGQQIESSEHKKQSAMGISVSSMANTDEQIDDKDKSIFDWLKEDNCSKVEKLLSKHDLNAKDCDVCCFLSCMYTASSVLLQTICFQ